LGQGFPVKGSAVWGEILIGWDVCRRICEERWERERELPKVLAIKGFQNNPHYNKKFILASS